MDMEILKRNKVNVFAIILIIIFTSGACRKKDATVKLPEVPAKLVLVSFVSPQDPLIKVSVTLSQPLYNNAASNSFDPVKDAVVQISSDLGSATLTYDKDSEAYTIDSTKLKIREGFTYHLSVSTPDGKHAEANTTIPAACREFSFSISSDSTRLACSLHDKAGRQDYYRIFLQNSDYFFFEGYDQNGSFLDTIRANYASSFWITDKDKDGEIISGSMQYTLRVYSSERSVFLLHVSEEYYNYGTRLLLADEGNSPFQEPTPMYSNISGGFGVFAGYNSYKLPIP